MTVIQLKIDGTKANISGGQWASEDYGLARLLQAMTATVEVGSPSIPDKDYHVAAIACETVGAEIISSEGPRGEEGVVY